MEKNKEFTVYQSGIRCLLKPDGGAFEVYVLGTDVGLAIKTPVIIGVVENAHVRACMIPATMRFLDNLALYMTLN